MPAIADDLDLTIKTYRLLWEMPKLADEFDLTIKTNRLLWQTTLKLADNLDLTIKTNRLLSQTPCTPPSRKKLAFRACKTGGYEQDIPYAQQPGKTCGTLRSENKGRNKKRKRAPKKEEKERPLTRDKKCPTN